MFFAYTSLAKYLNLVVSNLDYCRWRKKTIFTVFYYQKRLESHNFSVPKTIRQIVCESNDQGDFVSLNAFRDTGHLMGLSERLRRSRSYLGSRTLFRITANCNSLTVKSSSETLEEQLSHIPSGTKSSSYSVFTEYNQRVAVCCYSEKSSGAQVGPATSEAFTQPHQMTGVSKCVQTDEVKQEVIDRYFSNANQRGFKDGAHL